MQAAPLDDCLSLLQRQTNSIKCYKIHNLSLLSCLLQETDNCLRCKPKTYTLPSISLDDKTRSKCHGVRQDCRPNSCHDLIIPIPILLWPFWIIRDRRTIFIRRRFRQRQYFFRNLDWHVYAREGAKQSDIKLEPQTQKLSYEFGCCFVDVIELKPIRTVELQEK